jgi:long-chain acyl-CoA synthetase
VCELLFLLKTGAHISIPYNTDPKKIIREMKWKAPTLFYSVPKVLESIYKNDIHSIPSALKRNVVFGHRIRRISVGGALCPSKLVSFMTENYKIPTIQGYGMTETSPMISLNSIYENRIGSVGRPVKDVKIDFSIENNEILVEGENVMLGYLKEITNENEFVLEEKGKLFHTGDKGHLDRDGFLYINGRTKTEYKLSNGKYINPAFIEKMMCLSPLIDQAVVFGDGFAHNKAIIYSPKNDKRDKDAMLFHIKELLEGRVQHYEIPNDIVFAEEAFSFQNGLLTQKLEPNREKIMKLYT